MKEIDHKSFFNLLKKKPTEKLSPIYFFLGSEKFLKEEAVSEIKKVLEISPQNTLRTNSKDCVSILAEASIPNIFSEPKVIILDFAEKFSGSELAALIEYSKTPPPQNILVIKLEKLPFPLQEVKNAFVVNFGNAGKADLTDYVREKAAREGLTISQDAIRILIEMSNKNMLLVNKEIEKLSAYQYGSEKVVEVEDILNLLGFEKELNPYELSNAIIAKDGKKAIKIIEEMIKRGVLLLPILYTITRCFEKILKFKIYLESGHPTGVSPGQQYYLLTAEKNFSVKALKNILAKCLEAEAALKSSDTNGKILLKQIIYSALRKK